MEPVGAISVGECSSFNGLCSEEADFMAQLLGNCSLPNEVQSGFVWPAHESNIDGVDDSALYSLDETNIRMYSFSQGSSIYNEGCRPIFFPSSSHESYFPSASHQFFVTNNSLMTLDYSLMESKNNISQDHFLINNVMEGDDFLNQDVSNDSIESNDNVPEDVLQGKNLQLGMVHESPMPEPSKGDKVSRPPEIFKKRPRVPGEDQRNTRSMKLKKCLKLDNNEDDNNNAVLLKQSSSSCYSEDESNASHELSGGVTSNLIAKGSGALNSNGKTRASRGSATDPQSLYARKRRERINERLKILQNLVPNGTKVDISTMLEEAVQYVKFLQLQIKLLSSDDLWMYAPIAYNGMDIGL